MSPNTPFLNLPYFFRQAIVVWHWLISFDWLKYFLAAVNWFRLLSFFASVIFVILVAYLLVKLTTLFSTEKKKIFPSLAPPAGSESGDRAPRWLKIQKLLESDNPSDWKVAIIEADAMLDDMLKAMPYPGEDLGERLQAVEPSDFLTLDEAWEGHKVRNRIAHEGDYQLGEREARRVIGLYEKVFREFDLI